MYISGSYFKSHCRYRIGDYLDARNPVPSFVVSEDHDNNYVFCKTEFIDRLFDLSESLPSKFVLLTHNSDINICKDLSDHVLDEFPQISLWYAQNMMCYNPRIRPLPIGLANPKWEHGNADRFTRIISEGISKEEKVYINFNVQTNEAHRSYCLSQIGAVIDTKYPHYPDAETHNRFTRETQDKYLADMAKAFFVVSPFGNGADCHKTWEALYMRSIPIVIKTPMSEAFKAMDIPLVLLDDWADYKNLDLSSTLYNNIWGKFDCRSFGFDKFISVEERI